MTQHPANEGVHRWVIGSTYAFAYLNLAAYLVYYLLYLTGYSELPLNFDAGPFYLFVGCIVGGALPCFALYLRDEFDLLKMQHGTSGPSRIIWTALSLTLIGVMQYAFWTEVVH